MMEAIHIDCFPFAPGETLRKWICLTKRWVLSYWISESDYTYGKRKALLWFLLQAFQNGLQALSGDLVFHSLYDLFFCPPVSSLCMLPLRGLCTFYSVWFFVSFISRLYVTLSVRCFQFTQGEGDRGSEIIRLYMNPSSPLPTSCFFP